MPSPGRAVIGLRPTGRMQWATRPSWCIATPAAARRAASGSPPIWPTASAATSIGLHVRQAFQAPAFTDAGPAMDSLYRTYETAVRAEEAMATAAFRDAVGSKGISSEWRVADGYVDEILAAQARVADLVIVGQAEPDAPADRHAVRSGGGRRHGRRVSGADRALYRRRQAAGQDGDAVLERQPRSQARGCRCAAAARGRRQGDRADHRPQDRSRS